MALYHTLPVAAVFQTNICGLPVQAYPDIVQDVRESGVCILFQAAVPTKSMYSCFGRELYILYKLVCHAPSMKYIHNL